MMLKQKFKKLSLYAMAVVTLCVGFLSNLAITRAAETEETVNITEWLHTGEYSYVPVKCTVNGKEVTYTYDESNVRTGKCVDGAVTTYVYEEYTEDVDGYSMTRYKLVSENRNGKRINYLYNGTDIDKMTGFTYEGEAYTYLYDIYGNIYGIAQDGETIGTYIYDDNYVSYTISDSSDNGIMDINSIRYDGFYLDDETGYYYAGEKYNDLKNRRRVNKEVEYNNDTVMTRSSSLPEEVTDDIYYYTNYQLTYGGVSKPYTTNWYKNISSVDAIARTIYGEFCAEAKPGNLEQDNDKLYQQRKAVAWIIANRCFSSEFPNDVIEVIQQEDQFAALTGIESETWWARNPAENDKAWTQACCLAAYLYCAYSKNYTGVTANEILLNKMSRPTGIGNQRFFVSKSAWEAGYVAANGTFAFENGTPRRVKDVALNVGNVNEELSRNIFFDYK